MRMYSIEEIFEWIWSVELGKVESKPVSTFVDDDYEDSEFVQEDF